MTMAPQWLRTLLLATILAGQGIVNGLTLDVDDEASIKDIAGKVAYNTMSYYHSNESSSDLMPGKLTGTWWEGGALFMTLMQYWYWTGDKSYNDVTQTGMLWQKGNNDYFPDNQSNYLGNDDQVFWGLAAITAAELNFPERKGDSSWVSLAQGVFNTQVPRWDTTACAGGLRWQIWPYQGGYMIKNAVSNGGLFQLAARLARYTGNQTYFDWAEKIWDWSATTPLLKQSDWTIADTTNMQANCTDHGDLQWTYNYGQYLGGAAYMYNVTNGDAKWKEGIDGLLGTTFRTFFPKKYGSKTMSEVSCEPNMKCDRNQDCFKGFLSSWLTNMAEIVPYTHDQIMPMILESAQGAAQQCSGGDDGTKCGRRWYQDTWDGSTSMESDMSALSVISSTMFMHKKNSQGPLTADTGGKSKSDPTAGADDEDEQPGELPDISTGDRAGAGVVTVVFVAMWGAAMTWMVYGG